MTNSNLISHAAGDRKKSDPESVRSSKRMTEILRTPEERFANLPGCPWSPHSIDDLAGFGGLAMSYLDEGPATAPVFLCLHGEPTWRYLYRRMIPHFLATSSRVIAPDIFGFGRSDKPTDDATYTFDFHRLSLIAFVRTLNLRYAAEFFSGLFRDKKAMRRQKKFMPALKRLQDGLGDLNDIAVDERLIASAAAPKRAFVAGLLTGREEARENEALSTANDGYAKLVKAKSFWR